jgi:hypothetical protein
LRLNGNKLRSAAPQLYQAAGQALRVLVQAEGLPGVLQQEASKAIKALQEAIDLAEGDAIGGTIALVVTHRTFKELLRAVKADKSDAKLLAEIKRGSRTTKRRVYIELGVDPVALRRLRDILAATWPQGSSKRAFERLVEQIEEEVLKKSPLTLLADAGV